MRRLVAALLFALLAAPVFAASTFPALTGRVVDDANIIPAAVEAAIDGKLAAVEAKTGDQFVVVTLPSLQGYEIEDYGYQLGRHWAIGQQGKDNGLILIVAPNERAVRFEVGYGLEGTMTDALSRVIIESAILPRFRANDMAGGIERGVDDAIQVLTGDAAELQQLAERRPEEDGWWEPLIPFLIFLTVIILINVLRRRGGKRWAWLANSAGSSWSSGGRSWGGSSGGGFSGGGGSFGGGGATGRW